MVMSVVEREERSERVDGSEDNSALIASKQM